MSWTRQPHLWQSLLILGAVVYVFAESGRAAFIQVGSGADLPGEVVVIPLIFSEAPEPEVILTFSVTLDFSNEFAAPTIDAGSEQPNITAFIDVIEGIYRVTGLILAGRNIGNGEIVKLIFSIPSTLMPGDYPITTSNLEVRDISNQVVPSTAGDGQITVLTQPPVITRHPIDQAVNQGGSDVQMGIEAKGTPPLSYQWFKDGESITNRDWITGSTSPVIRISGPSSIDEGNYHCEVSNEFGTVSSNPALLTVFGLPGSQHQPNAAEVVDHSIPTRMRTFQELTIGITMRNTSNLTWSWAQSYGLAIILDEGGFFAGPVNNRIYIADPFTVVPANGGEYSFIESIKAPATPGTYTLEFEMVEVLAEYFGETLMVSIEVFHINTVQVWELYK